MNLLRRFIPRAKTFPRRIVLPEGQDPRVIAAAVKLKRDALCYPIVIGAPEEISAAEHEAGVSLAPLSIEACDPATSEEVPRLAARLFERRRAKGMSEEEAQRVVRSDRLYFGNLLLAEGLADGLVGGSIAATPDMLRAAFHCVGTAPGIRMGSSCFVMDLARPTDSGDDVLLYADCGVVPDPDVEQLVDIASATAITYRALLESRPRLAFLSFSTKGSSAHFMAEKMRNATECTRKRFRAQGVAADVDGELQADAALVPDVAARKSPDSTIPGNANVLIFPDLQSGNIAYKLTQRLAGAKAYGPILQGLARPVNDLSRGCSADDIVGVVLITVCQGL